MKASLVTSIFTSQGKSSVKTSCNNECINTVLVLEGKLIKVP